MRRLVLVTLLVLAGAVALGLHALSDSGYVILVREPWIVQTNLSVLGGALLLMFAAGYVLTRTAVGVWCSPASMRQWLRERHRRRARARLAEGMVALAEGRWATAERCLVQLAQASDAPLLNYLGAARAAQAQGALDRRDAYLSKAQTSMPAAELAVGLAQAELQLGQSQREQALATLNRLQELAPHHGQVDAMLVQLFGDLEDWPGLLEALAGARERKTLPAHRIDRLEERAWVGLLDKAHEAGGVSAQREQWERIPASRRREEALLWAYARARVGRDGESAELEGLLRDAVRRRWSPRLVYLYGLVDGADPEAQRRQAERWLADHPRDPVLRLTLGRLCVRDRLHAKAREHLEASVQARPHPETCRVLSELLEQMDDRVGAAERARQGLALAASPLAYFSATGSDAEQPE